MSAPGAPPASGAVADALAALDVRTLALAIHDASLPPEADADLGHGAPASTEAARLLAFARALGFNAIQLGPQGETDAGNASPYDATAFSRSTLALAWGALARGAHGLALLAPETLAALAAQRPSGEVTRVRHAGAYALARRALAAAHATWREALAAEDERGAAARALGARLDAFTLREAFWLEPYALYEALGELHGGGHRSGWGDEGPGARDARLLEAVDAAAVRERTAAVARAHAPALERYRFGQLLAHEQHAQARGDAAALGLRLLGDLAIGVGDRDAWAWPGAFLAGYRLGAPPSRTNPDGQPWGYRLLDPARREAAGPALAFFARRTEKLFAEYDGLRIDHPHGLVDPWVYRDDDPDPLHAVQHGARLYGAPALPDHPALARFAIVGPGDLSPDPRTARWADDWVARLRPDQVDRYAFWMDRIVAIACGAGRRVEDVACEVLSTLPRPVAAVLARHGLGRFRVTQKADLVDPRDVYRSENAAPEDWIMIGTHDTRPIWRLVDDWAREGSAAARARRLAERLAPQERDRAGLADALARDPGLLAHAHLAELFASRARHVLVFFTDLFGIAETYNEPGTVSEANWSVRLPRDWRAEYGRRLAGNRALSLPRALALALRAAGSDAARARAGLIARLEAEALAAPRVLGAA